MAEGGDKEASQALTSAILHTDTQQQHHHDSNAYPPHSHLSAEQQRDTTTNNKTPNSSSWASRAFSSKRSPLEIAVLVSLIALLATVVGLAISLSLSRDAAEKYKDGGLDPACFHALGGGSVRPGGSFASTVPDHCRQELAEYAAAGRGRYWREVEIAMVAAAATFGVGFKESSSPSPSPQHHLMLQHSPHTPSQPQQQQQHQQQLSGRISRSMLAGDPVLAPQHVGVGGAADDSVSSLVSRSPQLGGPVLEAPGTAVAGAAGMDRQAVVQAPPGPGRDKLIVYDIDETLLSNMQQILNPETWPWDKWVAAAAAPALEPSLRFYKAVCEAGYVMAFVTGRHERARNSTMHNLASAGYGRPCSEGPGPYYGLPSGSVGTSGSGSADSGRAQDHGAVGSVGGGVSGSASGCCYSALYMRTANDTTLASVYKPGARKDLLTRGNFTLVALLGDQFSDLNGEVAAQYAFKLPNPFYFIL